MKKVKLAEEIKLPTTTIIPVLRAAVTEGGWITLVIDPQNRIFHFWVGHLEQEDDIFEAFRAHIDGICDFIDDTRNKEHEKDVEKRKAYSDNAVKWLKHLVSEPLGQCAFKRGCGVTGCNKNGQIVCFAHDFNPNNPRSMAVLAHEIIHASIRFRDLMNIREDARGEFIANVHTTIFQRLLEVMNRADIGDLIWPEFSSKLKK